MATNPCKNCDNRDRDCNNNYLSNQCHGGYTTTNQNFNNNNNNNNTRNLNLNNSNVQPTVISTGYTASTTPIQQQSTQVTAKIMWGNKIAIKELREKEQAEKRQRGQPGRKQQN
jgi:hypothetical protein